MGPNPAESAPSTPREVDAFGPSFFLSYARVPPLRGDRSDPDYWVKRFFHELAAEIRSQDSKLGHGFIAGHVPPDANPETLTIRNLASCRIFVPLYGDDYFDDEQCGREWAGVRQDTPHDRNPEYYGEQPEDWRPYHPESEEPIVERAARIARSLGYRPEITVLTATSPETKINSQQKPLDPQFHQPPAASILLADPWLFRSYQQRRNLERVDQHRKQWVRLMVPWSATDHETAESRASLESLVRDAAPWMIQSWRRTCPQDLVNLATVEEFDLALPIVIERARHHFLNNVRPTRDSAAKSDSGKPGLTPPPEQSPPWHGPG
jgi:FxsC-like protein